MYEIWLMLNIVWEIALGAWPLLLMAAVLWLALMGTNWRTAGAHWRGALLPSLGIGLVMAVGTALMLPSWTQSALANMGYWVDWAILLGLAAAVGGAVAAFAWPLLAWRRGRSDT